MQVFVEKRQLEPGRMLQKSEVGARAQSKTWWGTKMPQLSVLGGSPAEQYNSVPSLLCHPVRQWHESASVHMGCLVWDIPTGSEQSASSCSAACCTAVRPLRSFIKSYSILGQMSDGFLSSLWELKGTCKWSTWQGVKRSLKICSFYPAACWITWRFMYSITENLVCVRRCLLRTLVCSEESSKWNGGAVVFLKHWGRQQRRFGQAGELLV